MLERMHAVGVCFQSDGWSDHPEYKPYRAMARQDPTHDFASIGAAMIGIDPVPLERLDAAASPVLVLNSGGDDPDDAAERLAAQIPGAAAVVAGTGNHVLACSDDAFQSAPVAFLRRGWPT